MRSIQGLMIVAAASSSALGDITYQSTERHTGTTVSDRHIVHSEGTTAPGPWLSQLYDEYTDHWHSPAQPTWGRAEQQSDFGTTYIVAVGRQGGFDGMPVGGVGEGSGSNSMRATFSLDEPTPYSLGLTYLIDRLYWNQFHVRLSGPSGYVFNIFDSGPAGGGTGWGTGHFTDSGILAPGVYSFEAYFIAGGSGASTMQGESRFDFALEVPAPCTSAALAAGVLVRRRRRA